MAYSNHVFPVFPGQRVMHRCPRHPSLLGENGAARTSLVKMTSLDNVGLCKHSVSRLSPNGAAPLLNFIRRVLRVSAKKQMIRSNAVSNITAMAHTHILVERAIRKLIGCPMRLPLLTVPAKRAIAVREHSAIPKPASLRFANLGPEAICNWSPSVALNRTVFSRTVAVRMERLAARLAVECYFNLSQGVNLLSRFAILVRLVRRVTVVRAVPILAQKTV